MKRRLILASVLGLVATLCVSCGCGDGSVCGSGNIAFFGPSSTPTPTPLPGATPDPCLVRSLAVSFHSGAQLPFIELGVTEQLDATGFNDGGQIPKGCDVAREPAWQTLTPTTCQILGSGWNPFVRGLRVGSCTVTASIVSENRTITSLPFTVEVR